MTFNRITYNITRHIQKIPARRPLGRLASIAKRTWKKKHVFLAKKSREEKERGREMRKMRKREKKEREEER